VKEKLETKVHQLHLQAHKEHKAFKVRKERKAHQVRPEVLVQVVGRVSQEVLEQQVHLDHKVHRDQQVLQVLVQLVYKVLQEHREVLAHVDQSVKQEQLAVMDFKVPQEPRARF
jgi:hypothetical protein